MAAADRIKELITRVTESGKFSVTLSLQDLLDLSMLVQQAEERDELITKYQPGVKPMNVFDTARRAEALLKNTPIGQEIDMTRMMGEFGPSFGTITEEMIPILKKYVDGKKVFDIMGGDGALAEQLVKLGAEEIVVIDKELSKVKMKKKGFKFYKSVLESVKFDVDDKPIQGQRTSEDVAFCSWIPNHVVRGLLDMLRPFKTVIYLGKNTDNSACAWPGFFREMRYRSCLQYVKNKKNSLLIYGPIRLTPGERDFETEEIAGIDHTKVYSFEEM